MVLYEMVTQNMLLTHEGKKEKIWLKKLVWNLWYDPTQHLSAIFKDKLVDLYNKIENLAHGRRHTYRVTILYHTVCPRSSDPFYIVTI